MNEKTLQTLEEVADSIEYFQSLHESEQAKLWPLLSKNVQSSIQLLNALSDKPKTYA